MHDVAASAVLILALPLFSAAGASAQVSSATAAEHASLAARLQGHPLVRELAGPPSMSRSPQQQRGDSVADGIAVGALAGAGAGVALVAVMYAQCDGTCDAPEPAPLYLSTAALGAGAGALVGWIVDAARKSENRVRVTPVVTPRGKAVRIAIRF